MKCLSETTLIEIPIIIRDKAGTEATAFLTKEIKTEDKEVFSSTETKISTEILEEEIMTKIPIDLAVHSFKATTESSTNRTIKTIKMHFSRKIKFNRVVSVGSIETIKKTTLIHLGLTISLKTGEDFSKVISKIKLGFLTTIVNKKILLKNSPSKINNSKATPILFFSKDKELFKISNPINKNLHFLVTIRTNKVLQEPSLTITKTKEDFSKTRIKTKLKETLVDFSTIINRVDFLAINNQTKTRITTQLTSRVFSTTIKNKDFSTTNKVISSNIIINQPASLTNSTLLAFLTTIKMLNNHRQISCNQIIT